MERRNGLSSYTEDERASKAADSITPGASWSDSALIQATKKDLSAAEKKNILRERALKLAKKIEAGRQDGETLEVIEFTLAHEHYAVEMAYIREVYALKDLTPVPCTPSYILGIINLRGQVISVTDIREFFDLPKKEISDQFRVLVLKNANMELGILAESVLGERKVPLEDVQSQLVASKADSEGYIKGVTKERLIILDMEKFLSDENIVVYQEVLD
jgi:purine-binding chemotaxis protein CheW